MNYIATIKQQLLILFSIIFTGSIMTEKLVESHGFKLRYVRTGKGAPALIIGSSYYYPRIFSKDFCNNYDCIFMDHRGFVQAPSNVDLSQFDLDALLNDIDLMRKDAQIDKAFIVGHSGHGYLALEYAKKYPQHALGVAIIGTGPDQSDQSAQAAEAYFEQYASQERKQVLAANMQHLGKELEAHPEKALITMLIRLGAKGWYDYNFDSTPLWKDVTVNMQMFNYVWGGVFKTIDITKDLEKFDIPIFLVLGKYDFIVAPYYNWDPIIPKFKNIEVHLFEKSGHTLQYEESNLFDQKFYAWTRKFLK